jgi:hypothetical protein
MQADKFSFTSQSGTCQGYLGLPCLDPYSPIIRDMTAEFVLSRGLAPPHSPSKELWVQGWMGPKSGLGIVVKRKNQPVPGSEIL